MIYSVLRTAVVLALFWGVGEYIQMPVAFSLTFGLVAAGVLEFALWYAAKSKIYTAQALRAKPFGELVPVDVVETIDSAPLWPATKAMAKKLSAPKPSRAGSKKCCTMPK